jgi:hypothetical protein
MRYTYEQIRHIYPRGLDDLRAVFLRRFVGDNGIAPRALATTDELTLEDRRWLLASILATGPRPDLRALVRWACACAADALPHITDPFVKQAALSSIGLAQLWARGIPVPTGALLAVGVSTAGAAFAIGAQGPAFAAASSASLVARAAGHVGDAETMATHAIYAAEAAAEASEDRAATSERQLLALVEILEAADEVVS